MSGVIDRLEVRAGLAWTPPPPAMRSNYAERPRQQLHTRIAPDGLCPGTPHRQQGTLASTLCSTVHVDVHNAGIVSTTPCALHVSAAPATLPAPHLDAPPCVNDDGGDTAWPGGPARAAVRAVWAVQVLWEGQVHHGWGASL